MGIWYATRERVKSALGSKYTARDDQQIDDAIETSSRAAETLCKRAHFYPWLGTRTFDWPQPGVGGKSYELELGEHSLITLVSVTAGGDTLDVATIVPEPVNSGPPFSILSIDTDTGTTFGAGTGGSQRRLAVVGLWGWNDDTRPAGALAEALDTSETGVDVTDSSMIGVGTLLRVDDERLVVTARTLLDTTQNLGAALDADNADDGVNLGDGTAFHIGEVITIDTERMLLVDIAGNVGTVKRAWDGTRLAAHLIGADIYAGRRLTVERAAAGTTAAEHDTATALTLWPPPAGIGTFTAAAAISQVENEQAGYARVTGEGEGAHETGGRQVESLAAQVRSGYGRTHGPLAV